LISYKTINKDWIDKVEIIEADRKYLLIVKKEILACNLPNKNGGYK